MVKPSFDDYVIGYMIFLKYHPDFPLDASKLPPDCVNTNPFIDGYNPNLIFSRIFLCSASLEFKSDGTLDFSPLRDDAARPWRYVCANFQDLDQEFPAMFQKRYEMVSSVADNETLTKEYRKSWIELKHKLDTIREDLDL